MNDTRITAEDAIAFATALNEWSERLPPKQLALLHLLIERSGDVVERGQEHRFGELESGFLATHVPLLRDSVVELDRERDGALRIRGDMQGLFRHRPSIGDNTAFFACW